ncbi:KNOTTED1-like homeobox gene 5 [Striga asiatica]|uniref:KNOTTED1-like homeobox gene 5 n=1 Tax=Striga asiatica TaxID=4170 RepID=A0A5A7Q030_STRAF|nr:KNOTTED1-like homeobox gene 5 [Striga asiatica]
MKSNSLWRESSVSHTPLLSEIDSVQLLPSISSSLSELHKYKSESRGIDNRKSDVFCYDYATHKTKIGELIVSHARVHILPLEKGHKNGQLCSLTYHNKYLLCGKYFDAERNLIIHEEFDCTLTSYI